MSDLRRFEGDETWLTLRDWTKGQKVSERLSGVVLQSEGYSEVDPSHPLGGKDGGKDILCRKDGMTFVGAVYFPRGQQSFPEIKKKFALDLQGVEKNRADGLVFVTNQELKLGERRELQKVKPDVDVELYHLERLTLLLNVPKHYGIRLEYLGIRVTEEEYLAFLAVRDEEHYRRFQDVNVRLDNILGRIEKQAADIVGYATGGESIVSFLPSSFTGTQRVELRLINFAMHPVFDIHGYYVDLDDRVDNPRFDSRRVFSFGTLYSKQASGPVLTFDLAGRDHMAINVFIHTRNKEIVQFFRFFNKDGTITIALKTQCGEEVIEYHVPTTVPNYNPNDPGEVFK